MMAGKPKRKATTDVISEKPASSKNASNKKAKKTETVVNEPEQKPIDNKKDSAPSDNQRSNKSKKIDKEIINNPELDKRQTRTRAVTFLLPDNSATTKDSQVKANKVEVKSTKSTNKNGPKKVTTNSKSDLDTNETKTAPTVSKRGKRKNADTTENDAQSNAKRSAKVQSGDKTSKVQTKSTSSPRRSLRSSTRASTAASSSVLETTKSTKKIKEKIIKNKTEKKKVEQPEKSEPKQSKQTKQQGNKGKKPSNKEISNESNKDILNDGDNNNDNDNNSNDNDTKISRLKKPQKESKQESKIVKSTSSDGSKRSTRKIPATTAKKSQSKKLPEEPKRTTTKRTTKKATEDVVDNVDLPPSKTKSNRKPKAKPADKVEEKKSNETSNEKNLKSDSSNLPDEKISNIDNDENKVIDQAENKTSIENAKIEEKILEEKPNDLLMVPSTSTSLPVPEDKNILEEKKIDTPVEMDLTNNNNNDNGIINQDRPNDIPMSNDNCLLTNANNTNQNASNEINCENNEANVDLSNKRKHDSLEDSLMPDKKKVRVILTGGDLFTMGAQLSRELGPREKTFAGRRVTKMQPSRLKIGSKKIVNLAAGALHTLAITESGQVISFGCNDDFVLGRSITQGDNNNMENVSRDDSDNDDFMEDLTENEDDLEEVLSCTPLPIKEIKEKVIKVSAGDMHSAALCVDGKVFIWGHFKDDSDKIGIFSDCQKLPTSFDYSPTILPRQIEFDKFVVDIASGSNHFLMLTDDGKCYTIGDGSKGQLGRIPANQLKSIKTERELFLKPQQVPLPEKIESIFASQWNSFAVTKNGTLYGWGLNNFFQLGIPTEEIVLKNNDKFENYLCALEPIRIPLSFAVDQVANGQQHTLLLDTDGNVYSCGSALYGKLGLGEDLQEFCEDNVLNKFIKIPSEDFNYERVVNITCGDFFSMVITETGKLYRWGEGNDSVDHAESDLFSPTLVEGAFADCTKFSFVSAGSQFSAMIGIVERDENTTTN